MPEEKRPINWAEIKKRYLSGEKPHSIAKDYYGLKPRAITDRAYREGWKEQREEIYERVPEMVVEDLKEYKSIVIQLRKKLLQNLMDQESALEPLFFTKIKANPYTKAVLSSSLEALLKGEAVQDTQIDRIEVHFADPTSADVSAEDPPADSDG